MLTIDCKDVLSIKNELVVYVSDQVVAIPTLKHHQFTLSTFDDDEIIDINNLLGNRDKNLQKINNNLQKIKQKRKQISIMFCNCSYSIKRSCRITWSQS